MADKENKHQTLDDKLKTDERVRGNHAWNTCDGGVRGLAYSPERMKELAEKKYRKNYWKIGALAGAGIGVAAIAGIIGYSFLNTEAPMPQKTIQEDVLSREEALERYAPRIEYYGVPKIYESYCDDLIEFYDDLDACQRYAAQELFHDYIISEVNNKLNTFCLSGGFWNSELHCFVEECEDDDNNSKKDCVKKDVVDFKLKDIVDIKGVVINDELAYVEISAIEYVQTSASELLENKDQRGYILDSNELYDKIMVHIHHNKIDLENKKGLIKINERDEDNQSGVLYLSELSNWELVIEIDGSNIGENSGVYEEEVDMWHLKGIYSKYNQLYYSIEQEIESYLSENPELNINVYELGKTEFVLFEWEYQEVKRNLKPDQTKNTPEESILLVYELVDKIRTLIENY